MQTLQECIPITRISTPTPYTRVMETDDDGDRLNRLVISAEYIVSAWKLLGGGGRQYRSGGLACIV